MNRDYSGRVGVCYEFSEDGSVDVNRRGMSFGMLDERYYQKCHLSFGNNLLCQ